MNPTAALLVCSLTLSAVVLAQGADAVRASYGVSQHDGEVRAGGPGYSARFDGRGIEFLPLSGKAAEPVRFTLASVRRGSVDVWTRGEGTAPTVAGDHVSYQHGPQLTEIYDARADGIEQGFVFAERPAGRGDLVVCGAITTDLPLAAVSDDGVRYARAGGGGVTFGAVTGIDANGATVRGSIRAGADHVEWVLPAAFVDNACYPIVLDPLIGTAFLIGNGANGNDIHPSVAFDATSARYLVVWNVTLASGDPEMRCQLVGTSGALVGGQVFLGYGTLTRQAVANIDGSNRFVVVFATKTIGALTSSTVKALAVTASSGAVSSAVLIDSAVAVAGYIGHAIVGGDSRPVSTAQTALVVFAGLAGEIMTRIVHVPPTGDPIATAASATNLGLSGGWAASITDHGGPSLQWLVAWQAGSAPGHTIGGGAIGSSAVWCAAPSVLFVPPPGDDVDEPVSATADGANFLVAWRHTSGGLVDLQARMVTITGTCGSALLGLGSVNGLSAASYSQSAPALAFAKDRFVIAWRDQFDAVSPARVLARSLEPVTCATCGTVWSVETTGADQVEPAIASRYSSGDTASDELLIAWSNGTIRGCRFEARGSGAVANVGGGCAPAGGGGGGTVPSYSGMPVLGETTFALTLSAPTAPVLAVIVGLSNISLPCGACTLVPNLDIVMTGAGPHPLPLPCDLSYLGVTFWAQWLLLAPSSCPILPDFVLSNALQFTIGE